LLDTQKALDFLNGTNPFQQWASPFGLCCDVENLCQGHSKKETTYAGFSRIDLLFVALIIWLA